MRGARRGIFSSKKSTVGAFVVPFRILIEICDNAFITFTSRKYSKLSSLSLSLKVLFKISNGHSLILCVNPPRPQGI